MHTARLVIDVQQARCSGEFKAFESERVIERINSIARRNLVICGFHTVARRRPCISTESTRHDLNTPVTHLCGSRFTHGNHAWAKHDLPDIQVHMPGTYCRVLSWFGVVLGFTVHMICASIGLTALFMAVPLGYELLKFAGAVYLLWLAWQAVRPGARSPFEAKSLPTEPPRKLFVMGLLTSVLNPKVAIFYLSVLPQFIAPESGSVLAQSIVLGVTQVCIGSSVNLVVTLSAAAMAGWFSRHSMWLALQRYVMGLVLGALAFKLLSQQRSAA